MPARKKALLIELDAATAARLDQAVPPRTRRRSEFVRNAIRQALWALDEAATAAAYARQPDTEPAAIDLHGWDEWNPPPRKSARRKR